MVYQLRSVPSKQRFVQVWAGTAGYKNNLDKHTVLPAACVLNKEGVVVERYTGRIPPEA